MRDDWITFAKTGELNNFDKFSDQTPNAMIYSNTIYNAPLKNERFYRFMSDFWNKN